MRRPNIVLLVSDDHGREALGCYGNPVIQTPHLDALARSGVRFSNAFCTAATCAANLAERPGHQELVRSFIEKLKAFQQQTKDPWFHKWTYE